MKNIFGYISFSVALLAFAITFVVMPYQAGACYKWPMHMNIAYGAAFLSGFLGLISAEKYNKIFAIAGIITTILGYLVLGFICGLS